VQGTITIAAAEDPALNAALYDGKTTIPIDARILVPNQGAASGIYLFKGAGNALVRAADMSGNADVLDTMEVRIAQGGNDGEQSYRLTTDFPIGGYILGTTSLLFEKDNSSPVPGQVTRGWKSVAANYAIGSTDYTVAVDSTGGDRTIDLPDAAAKVGRIVVIYKSDGSGNKVIVRVDPANAGQRIQGSPSVEFTYQWQGAPFQSTGTNWVHVGG